MRTRRPSPSSGSEAVLKKWAPGLEDKSDRGGHGNWRSSGEASLSESDEVAGLGAGLRDMNAEGSKVARSSRVILACRRLALMLGGDGEREEGSSSSMIIRITTDYWKE